MRWNISLIVLSILTSIWCNGQQLIINEVMASNSYVLSDNFGEFDDWIEIYNPGTTPIDLAGYYFSDNPNIPFKYKIPDTGPVFTTIAPNGYLVFWADTSTSQGPTHLNFKLSSSGEFISIYSPTGLLIDALSFPEQEKNYSYSRIPNGTGPFLYCDATAYGPNTNEGFNGFIKSKPIFSISRGVYSSAQNLDIDKDFVDGEIRFTLDGTAPTKTSTLFNSTISITNNTVVRAAVFGDSLIQSDTYTHSYIIDNPLIQTIPVVSISGDSEIFYDPTTGLLTQNFLPSWEYSVNFEIINLQENSSKSQEVGCEILQAEDEWMSPQKPLTFTARDQYSKNKLKHQLFPEENVSSFKSFSLRSAGKDWGSTLIKDGFYQRITKQNLDLDNRFYMPTSVFINGTWQGVYNLRSSTNEDHIQSIYGYDNDSVTVIKGNGVLVGTPDEYNDWVALLETVNLSDSASFVHVSELMDVKNYTDYIISLLFLGNEKWATENAFQWKSAGNSSKWRWFLRGGDNGMKTSNINNYLLTYFTDPIGGIENPDWLTLPLRKLLENPSYRTYFLSELANQFYITFHSNTLNAEMNNLSSEIMNYIPTHATLWNGTGNGYVDPIISQTAWNDSLAALSAWFGPRGNIVRSSTISYFPEVSTTYDLNLNIQLAGAGKIVLNNLVVPEESWTGKYFGDLPFKLTAVALPGFTFAGWEGTNVPDTTLAVITTSISQSTTITAHYLPATTLAKNVLISEIKYIGDTIANNGDWIELFNPSDQWVSMGGWALQDGTNKFIIPQNVIIGPNEYRILSNDKIAFTQWFYDKFDEDVSDKVLGNFDFGLSSNRADLLLLNDINTIIDSVSYLNASPWPVMNNPDSVSIELVNYQSDNSYGHNWFRSNTTHGTPLDSSSFYGIHIGKIENQEINFGDSFVDIDLKDYIYTNGAPISSLAIQTFGNMKISASMDNQYILHLNYSNWKGYEWIKFSIADNAGNSSIDSALFLVGTLLNSVPCNVTYSSSDSPIVVQQSLTIPQGCVMTIESGVEVRMKKNTEIIVQGQLLLNGNASDSITIQAHDAFWNAILLDSNQLTSTFSFVSFRDATYGSDSTKMNAAISGYYGNLSMNDCSFQNTERSLYGYSGNAYVENCKFLQSNGEKVNFQFTNATVKNCYFSPSYGDFDAIDFDAVNKGLIEGNYINYSEDDGIDIGQIEGVACDSLRVLNNYVTNVFDKAISIGEGSTDIFVEGNILVNSYYGIAIKDGSFAHIDHNTIDANNFGIALFEKNDGLVGSYANVTNTIISGNINETSFIDGTSTADFSYCLSDELITTGVGNLAADPGFADNYELAYYSACINTGAPSFLHDTDGTITDIGARWYNTGWLDKVIGNKLTIFPNPATKGQTVLISWNWVEAGNYQIMINDASGRIVHQDAFKLEQANDLNIRLYELENIQLSQGIYNCTIIHPSGLYTGKLVVTL